MKYANAMKINITVLLMLICCCFVSASYGGIAIIVNPANSHTLTDDELKKAFLGKLKKFPDGSSMVVVNQKTGDIRDTFEMSVIKKRPRQVKAYWSKMVFSGKARPPIELEDDDDIIAFVAKESGAIGYIDETNINKSVRVIKVF